MDQLELHNLPTQSADTRILRSCSIVVGPENINAERCKVPG
jgi:hypothetical protein